MPRRDGTGPDGKGPNTGRGEGPCKPGGKSGGSGAGQGSGRGGRRGGGRRGS